MQKERDLMFLEQYPYDSNGQHYECFKFLDLLTLKVLVGINLTQEELVKNRVYKGSVMVKSYGGKDSIRIAELNTK